MKTDRIYWTSVEDEHCQYTVCSDILSIYVYLCVCQCVCVILCIYKYIGIYRVYIHYTMECKEYLAHPLPPRPLALAAFAANTFSHNLVKKVVLCIESSHDNFEVFLQSRHVPCTDQKCSAMLHDTPWCSAFMHFQHHDVAPEDLVGYTGTPYLVPCVAVRYPTLLPQVASVKKLASWISHSF